MMSPWIACALGAASFLALLLLLFFVLHIVANGFLSGSGKGLLKNAKRLRRKGRRPRKFTLKEIHMYSEEFSNKIGNGSTNTVFKGNLPDGTEVAIKRPNAESMCSLYVAARTEIQIELLSRIRHQNLVNLVGHSDEAGCQVLLFQYASNGTLYENLHGNEHLTWKQRTKIIGGIAYGLHYLHSCVPPVIHGDLCSQIVLLTEDYAAKIGGIGKSLPGPASAEKEKRDSTTQAEGMEKGEYSSARDVYAFGILIIEIVSGKMITSADGACILDQWTRDISPSQEKMLDFIDPSMHDVPIPELAAAREIVRLCLRSEPHRPTMADIVELVLKDLKITIEAAAPLTSPVTLRGLLELLV
ncbi:protein MALE DISCOVERER 1-like [Nymphaea colorata]|nr:protein MALE DISCOVERER 1-like [Nymphaea colorata]